jgi:glycosyltransferase involved in cell wall biosynthesis
LAASIESVLAQSYGDFELIVMDDASPDETGEVVRRFGDARIRYVRNERNLNMPGNLNAGIALAGGTYIANLHDGDLFAPDLITRWKRALDEQPDAPFVFNDYDAPDGAGRVVRRPPFLDEVAGGRYPGRLIARHYLRTMTSCVWGTVMARAEAYRQGGFDARFGAVADVEMWLRLGVGRSVAYIDEPLIQLAAHEEGHFWRVRDWEFFRWDVAIHRRCCELYAGELPEEVRQARARLPWLAGKKAARMLASQLVHRRWDALWHGIKTAYR